MSAARPPPRPRFRRPSPAFPPRPSPAPAPLNRPGPACMRHAARRPPAAAMPASEGDAEMARGMLAAGEALQGTLSASGSASRTRPGPGRRHAQGIPRPRSGVRGGRGGRRCGGQNCGRECKTARSRLPGEAWAARPCGAWPARDPDLPNMAGAQPPVGHLWSAAGPGRACSGPPAASAPGPPNHAMRVRSSRRAARRACVRLCFSTRSLCAPARRCTVAARRWHGLVMA